MTDVFQPPPAFFEFRIVRPLGKGAMGEVFLADDEVLGRQVAIKFVREADRPEMRARFLLEARALARLSHPNVVTVHRVGEVLGRPFIVSEWIKGKSLDQWPLPLEPSLVLRVALQLARALAAVHRAGVLHRDIKPANVLLSESLDLKLVDFGVSAGFAAVEASAPRNDSLAQTQPLPAAVDSSPVRRALLQVGTPLYAAPELLAGEPGTRLSDLYAWGALVYEVSTGHPPHQGATLDELRTKAASGSFAPLTDGPVELIRAVHASL
ncbi:MAG: serine/threonine-protein kinase, partial [Myxococcales bacterium]